MPQLTKQQAYNRAYYIKNRDKLRADTKAYREANREKVSAWNKGYVDEHKDELRAYTKAYREKNRDKLNSYDRARRNDKRKAQEAAYSAENRDKRKAYAKQYRKDHPTKVAEANIRTREVKSKRTPAWSKQILTRMFYVQAKCMRLVHGIQYDVDHIIPLRGKAVSGLHVHNNLRVITSKENGLKGNKYG